MALNKAVNFCCGAIKNSCTTAGLLHRKQNYWLLENQTVKITTAVLKLVWARVRKRGFVMAIGASQ